MASRAAMAPASSAHEAAFSRMRTSLCVLGMAIAPWCSHQPSTTCAGLAPSRRHAGCSRPSRSSGAPLPPKGVCAIHAISRSAQKARSSCCWHTGCTQTQGPRVRSGQADTARTHNGVRR